MSIIVRAVRGDDPRRWVRLCLSSRTPAEEERTISYSNWFQCSIQALDAEAEAYHLEVWESGILSGLTFVFRRSSMRGAMLHFLEGHLGAEDMEGVAYAATIAGILATECGIPEPVNQNWVIMKHEAK